MPEFTISLDRRNEHIADYKIEMADIYSAHLVGRTIKSKFLAHEKYDSFGEPKIPEDILLTTKYKDLNISIAE